MKKRRWLLPVFALSALMFLSACGAEEVPVPENDLISDFNKLAVETVWERSKIISESVEVMVDQIYHGSFSRENADEIFVECRLLNMPHIGGLDSRAGVLLDADTMEVTAYKDFYGDEIMLNCLQTANGQNRILCLGASVNRGFRTPRINLYAVQGSEWVEIPTDDIKELFPKKKGYEGDFEYYMTGERLIVTWESFSGGSPDQISDPAELIAILVWDPHTEHFVLDSDSAQPAASWISGLSKLAEKTVIENSDFGSSVEEGYYDVVIDQIHYGSFTRKNTDEIFMDCKLEGMPHLAGFDTRAGILLDADTLELIAYREFAGDEVMLKCLETADGQSRILCLSTSVSVGGYRGTRIELYAVQGSEWAELPVGIEDLIPPEYVTGEKEQKGGLEYYMTGERLVVTWESDPKTFYDQVQDPAELVSILVWNPFKEQFVMNEITAQPAGSSK